jgi:hypothetical protein
MMPVDLADIWYAALAAPIGVEVETNSPDKLRHKLYMKRNELKDENLAGLSILISPLDPSSKLWVIKRVVQNGP